jgi:hypothetical protein
MKKRYVAQAGIVIEDENLIVTCGHEHYKLDQALRCCAEFGGMGNVATVKAVTTQGVGRLALRVDEREALRSLAGRLSVECIEQSDSTYLVFA